VGTPSLARPIGPHQTVRLIVRYRAVRCPERHPIPSGWPDRLGDL